MTAHLIMNMDGCWDIAIDGVIHIMHESHTVASRIVDALNGSASEATSECGEVAEAFRKLLA